MERGLTSAVSREDFPGWVLGFYNEQSDGLGLAKLPMLGVSLLAEAQIARWQSKYGRDPTDQERSWLVNKIRTDTAMIGIKLNAQVIIKNLQNMHAKSLPPTGARAREIASGARISGLGPPARQGITHGRTQRPPSGVADVIELGTDTLNDSPADPSLTDRF